jgi:porphobilinogen synthase
MLDLLSRPRRNRKSAAVRSFHRETWLSPAHFIYPLFVHDRDGVGDVPIASMPGCSRLSADGLMREVDAARADGIASVVLFPAVDDARKNSTGDEAWNPEGLIPTLVRRLKQAHPDLVVVTDVALDPYNSDGHDGVVDASGPTPRILNDRTVEILCRQAVCQAEAGADVVSPSDMMDGRIGAIRRALDAAGHTDVSILSYCAKYASASTARSARPSTRPPASATRRPTRWTRPTAARPCASWSSTRPRAPTWSWSSRRARSWTSSGACARPRRCRWPPTRSAASTPCSRPPAERGWLDERRVVLESLIGIRRAGADVILTYYARQAARWLAEGGLAP